MFIEVARCLYKSSKCSEENSEPFETSKIELFAKIVNDLKALTIFGKNSILNAWLNSDCACLETTIYFTIKENISLFNKN